MLASPVGGNPAQYMIEKAFAFHDLDWRYLTFEVAPADLDNAMRGLRALGFCGVHCGDPHKQAIIPLLDRTTETAAIIGIVNFVFRQNAEWIGENTEGRGIVETIAASLDVVGKRAIVLGAGRVGRAVAVELAAAGVAGLTIVDRKEERAAELAALLTDKYGSLLKKRTGSEPAGEKAAEDSGHEASVPSFSALPWTGDFAVPVEAELLVHATSLGHRSDNVPLPLDLETLRPELFVADVAVGAPQTWLLNEAAQRGCKTADGLSMFIHQVAIGFRQWTGVDPDRQVLREAVEEFWEL